MQSPCHATLAHNDEPITFRIGTRLAGYRLRDIHIRLTTEQMIDPNVRAWLLEDVYPRRALPSESVHIELEGR